MVDIPEDVIAEYKLKNLETADGYIYIEVQKEIYGLPHAGLTAQQLLEKRLNAKGFRQSQFTPGLWTHDTHPIILLLVVDDFGVKYISKENAEYLMNVLQEHYKISHSWGGTKYAGIMLDWDYQKRQVHLSIPGYVRQALTCFQHGQPKKRKISHTHMSSLIMEPRSSMWKSRMGQQSWIRRD